MRQLTSACGAIHSPESVTHPGLGSAQYSWPCSRSVPGACSPDEQTLVEVAPRGPAAGEGQGGLWLCSWVLRGRRAGVHPGHLGATGGWCRNRAGPGRKRPLYTTLSHELREICMYRATQATCFHLSTHMRAVTAVPLSSYGGCYCCLYGVVVSRCAGWKSGANRANMPLTCGFTVPGWSSRVHRGCAGTRPPGVTYG